MPLDIRRLAKAGVLTSGRVVGWQWTVNERLYASIEIRADHGVVTLAYSHTRRSDLPAFIEQKVEVVTTPATLGGHRCWFACPTCHRRVAVIYGAGRLFACRKCKGLSYASQSEPGDDRAARRANRIRKRLGWPIGILNPDGGKPKGMHWQTFWQLKAQHDALVTVSLKGVSRRLGLVWRSMESVDEALDGLR